MIAGLVAACRAAGIRVSAAETLDAVAAAAKIGLHNKQAFKMALSIALAKTEADKKIFDKCFERYVQLMPKTKNGEDKKANAEEIEQMAEMMSVASEIELDKIQLFTQRGLFIRRLMEGMGSNGNQSSASNGVLDDEAKKTEKMREHAKHLVDRQLEISQGETSFKTRSEMLMDRVFSETDQHDLEIMSYQVRRLAKKLALASSRRHKKNIRGVPDIARSLRENLKNDGQMFNLIWQQRKINRPRIFAICDVSGSVSSAARFLLMFLYNLTEVVSGVRAFAFSNRLGEVSGLFNESEFAEAYSQALRLHGGGSTDYGESLKDFENLAGTSINKKTILIILGDARSNYGDYGAQTLARIGKFAGRLIWLNPEGKSLWGSGDSEMLKIAPLCHSVHPCQNLRGLTHIIDDMMKVRV